MGLWAPFLGLMYIFMSNIGIEIYQLKEDKKSMTRVSLLEEFSRMIWNLFLVIILVFLSELVNNTEVRILTSAVFKLQSATT